jgi:hypothetical protein
MTLVVDPGSRLAGLENDTMNISHKLITLGLAFSLLGGTSAFARPTPHFENGRLPQTIIESHVPTAITSGATGYARRPSTNAVKDDWPADMLQQQDQG